jgi:precorrin-3B C17-methyltransferase
MVIGYHSYLEMIVELLDGKEVLAYGMTEEVLRARSAVESTLAGKRVVVISGGDPGVYGMAGLVLAVAAEQGLEVTIVPGVTAATAAASRLGAPLMHDFAVISLSDRQTPWELIARRLENAASSDMVIVLYNPKSKGRTEQLAATQQIILKQRDPKTPVGIVSGAYRPEEETILTNLEDLPKETVSMASTVIIGNSQTKVINGRMITPRGYSL